MFVSAKNAPDNSRNLKLYHPITYLSHQFHHAIIYYLNKKSVEQEYNEIQLISQSGQLHAQKEHE